MAINPKFRSTQYAIEHPKCIRFKCSSVTLRIIAKMKYKAGIMPSKEVLYHLDKLLAKHYID